MAYLNIVSQEHSLDGSRRELCLARIWLLGIFPNTAQGNQMALAHLEIAGVRDAPRRWIPRHLLGGVQRHCMMMSHCVWPHRKRHTWLVEVDPRSFNKRSGFPFYNRLVRIKILYGCLMINLEFFKGFDECSRIVCLCMQSQQCQLTWENEIFLW